MDISEVRVKLVNNSQERLKAFCSITLENDFVIRDLKVIDGANGTFVAMPSRKLADRCPHCGYKNHLRAHYCNECGKPLGENRARRGAKRGKLHADIAHPINAACRQRIQSIVIEAFEEELEKSKQPGYKPPEFDFGEDPYDDDAAGKPAPSDKPVGAAPTDDDGGGYDQLIAELKSDAQARRKDRADAPAGEIPEKEKERVAAGETQDRDSSSASGTPGESEKDTAADDFGAGIL